MEEWQEGKGVRERPASHTAEARKEGHRTAGPYHRCEVRPC